MSNFKEWFEANFLDGEEVSDSRAMLWSKYVYEQITPYISTEVAKARSDELRIIWNLPKDKGLVYLEEHIQKRQRKLNSKTADTESNGGAEYDTSPSKTLKELDEL